MDRTLERLTAAGYEFADWCQSPATRTAAAVHLKSGARILTATLAVVYLGLACSTFFFQSQPDKWIPADNPNFYIDTGTGRVKDAFGRERIFHGVNVVFKSDPWLPQTDSFHPQLSFSDEDVEILRRMGLNSIRLGVMWPGVHPEKADSANHTYLGEIRKLVQKLHSAGIYTLVDFHQDVFGSRFCGEGVPDWLVDNTPFSSIADITVAPQPQQPSSSVRIVSSTADASSPGQRRMLREQENREQNKTVGNLHDVPCVGYAVCMTPGEYAQSFPEPLLPRFGMRRRSSADDISPEVLPQQDTAGLMSLIQQRNAVKDSYKVRNAPSLAQCQSLDWGIYHLTFAVSRAFQDLYENRWGWRDRLAEYWRDVATALKGEEGVLGYDLINEPWAGDVFFNPLLFAPGVADRLNFAPMYEHLQQAIRRVDPNRLIFFEGLTFDDFTSGFTQVPGGEVYANMSVMSYHYYRPPNVAPRATFKQKDQESRRLKCGWMLTEFGIPNRRPDWLNSDGRSGDGRLPEVQGVLKPGVACLPVEEKEEAGVGTETGKTSCSQRKNTCAGASAQSWEEFVQAWSSKTNSSVSLKPTASFSAVLPPCGDAEVSSERKEQAEPEPSSIVLTAADVEIKTESQERRALKAQLSASAHRVIRPKPVEQRRSTRGPVPKALQQLSQSFFSPTSLHNQRVEPEDLDSGLSGRNVVPGSWNELVETLELADEHQQSWMAWEYKPFVPITGANYGLFQPDGSLHPIVLQHFWRTYPVAVAGEVQAFSFDPHSSSFSMTYVAVRVEEVKVKKSWRRTMNSLWKGIADRIVPDEGVGSRTKPEKDGGSGQSTTSEVFVCCNRAMKVEVEPANIVQEWDAQGSILRLQHNKEHSGVTVSVRISPL